MAMWQLTCAKLMFESFNIVLWANIIFTHVKQLNDDVLCYIHLNCFQGQLLS